MSIPWLWLHNTSSTTRSIFSWQHHQILWPHMKPARPTNAPSPSPPGQRNCGFSSNPMKGTVPEASRFPMWHTMVSTSHDAQAVPWQGWYGCALNWRNWLPSQLEDAGKHTHSASQAGWGRRTWLTHWGHILSRHLGTLIMGMKKNGLGNTGKASRTRCENMAIGVRQLAVSSRTCVGDLLSVSKSDFLDFQWWVNLGL